MKKIACQAVTNAEAQTAYVPASPLPPGIHVVCDGTWYWVCEAPADVAALPAGLQTALTANP